MQKTFHFLTGAVVLVLLGSTGCRRGERFSPPAGLSPPFTLSELKVEFTHNPLPPFLILSSPGKRSEFREGKGIWIRLGEKEVGEDCIYSFRTRIPLELPERGFKARVSFRVHRFSADDLCVGF